MLQEAIEAFYEAKRAEYTFEVEIKYGMGPEPHIYRQIFRNTDFVSVPMKWKDKSVWMFNRKAGVIEFCNYMIYNYSELNMFVRLRRE